MKHFPLYVSSKGHKNKIHWFWSRTNFFSLFWLRGIYYLKSSFTANEMKKKRELSFIAEDEQQKFTYFIAYHFSNDNIFGSNTSPSLKPMCINIRMKLKNIQ